jgi:Arc/MetJ family transcription regulator
METIGELIEKLIIENIRLWHLQDKVNIEQDDAIVANVAKNIIITNQKRSALRAEVSKRLGEHESSIKLYG